MNENTEQELLEVKGRDHHHDHENESHKAASHHHHHHNIEMTDNEKTEITGKTQNRSILLQMLKSRFEDKVCDYTRKNMAMILKNSTGMDVDI